MKNLKKKRRERNGEFLQLSSKTDKQQKQERKGKERKGKCRGDRKENTKGCAFQGQIP